MDEAVETYEAEIEVSRTSNDLAGLVRAWSNLGITHGTLKSYQRAVECHSKALMVANDAQDRAVSAFGAVYVLVWSVAVSRSDMGVPSVCPQTHRLDAFIFTSRLPLVRTAISASLTACSKSTSPQPSCSCVLRCVRCPPCPRRLRRVVAAAS